jgi:hypothetical protein
MAEVEESRSQCQEILDHYISVLKPVFAQIKGRHLFFYISA